MLDASGIRYFVEPPAGLPPRKVILPGQTATMTASAPSLFPFGVVRFTKDGSDPTASSPLLDGPLTVGETTTIAAALFLPSGRSSAVVRTAIVQGRPRPGVTVERPEASVFYTYVEADLHRLSGFNALPAKARGRASAISREEMARVVGRMRAERFGLLFEGFVRVRSPGIHRFVATSNDGIRVEVGGEVLFEDDGEHEARESSAEIALEPGLYRLRVSYFQGTGDKALDLRIEGPDLPLGPLDLVVDGRTRQR
jgi:hexosaminidase